MCIKALPPMLCGMLLVWPPGIQGQQACDDVYRCCETLREALRSESSSRGRGAGFPSRGPYECNTAYLLNDIARRRRGFPPCQELLLYYQEWAYNLWEAHAIPLVPPACSRGEPQFEMESPEPSPFTIEPTPPEPEPEFEMEYGPAAPAPAEPEFEMIFEH
jgi:hypothetical protein